MAKILLIDGSNYLFRAYHALPPLTTSKGEPTGALKGFYSMLTSVYETVKPDFVACVFDAHAPTFRHELYAEYKANRPPMPEDLRVQVEPIHELVRILGWPLIEIAGVEADDVLASLAKKAASEEIDALIATGDKDLSQCVNDRVHIINTMTNTILDREGVKEKFGVYPESIIDYLTLIGDKVDNVPGINKCGPKTAVKWLTEFGSLEGVIEHASDVKGKIGEYLREGIPGLALTKRLVTVKDTVDVGRALTDLVLRPESEEKRKGFFERWEMRGGKKSSARAHGPTVTPTVVSTLPFDCPTEKPLLNPELRETIVTTLVDHRDALSSLVARLNEVCATGASVGVHFDVRRPINRINVLHDTIEAIVFCVNALETYTVCLEAGLDAKTAFSQLSPWFEGKGAKVFYDAKYARHLLKNHGVTLGGRIDDVMLMSYVLEAHLKHDLESIARRHLSFDVNATENTDEATPQLDLLGALQTRENPVTVRTAAAIKTLGSVLREKLMQNQRLLALYETIEMPVNVILYAMEREGVMVDTKRLAALSSVLKEKVRVSEETIVRLAGEPFNPSSPKQLAHILFEKLGLPVKKKTASGTPSTDEEVLQELALDFPLPKEILEYRKLTKLIGTYTDKLPQMIDRVDGRIHTTFGQATAVTGRLASSEPNLQNIPIRTPEGHLVRETFVARPGCKIVSADYSQIELRIMAHLAEDAGLLAAFRANEDVHRATAAEVFGHSIDAVTSDERRMAKVINFGLIYGMSAFGLAKNLGIERHAAANYIEQYFRRYPSVSEYMERTRTLAQTRGYVETAFGRRLWLPDIAHARSQIRAGAERAAINAPMQGTAADLIKLAMIAVDGWLRENGLKSRLILQVHDELILEVPENEVKCVCESLEKLMAGVARLLVELKAEVGVGENWEAAH